ncbi:MAG: hypothetical protein ACFFCU_08795 [Promethearchaeota archaeon]
MIKGQIIRSLIFGFISGCILAVIIGIIYYRFKWLDSQEDDVPDIRAVEPIAETQVNVHILFKKLLPSSKFCWLVVICTIVCTVVILIIMLSAAQYY